jgi:hypothetical protein
MIGFYAMKMTLLVLDLFVVKETRNLACHGRLVIVSYIYLDLVTRIASLLSD